MSKTKECIPSITAQESQNVPLSVKERAKQKLEEILPRQMQLVEGTFVNEETKDGSLPLDLPSVCKGVPPFRMTLEDGRTYKIPRWVANHLNGIDEMKDILNPDADKRTNSCAVGISTYQIGKNDLPKVNMDLPPSVPAIGTKYRRRFRFVPTSFGE